MIASDTHKKRLIYCLILVSAKCGFAAGPTLKDWLKGKNNTPILIVLKSILEPNFSSEVVENPDPKNPHIHELIVRNGQGEVFRASFEYGDNMSSEKPTKDDPVHIRAPQPETASKILASLVAESIPAAKSWDSLPPIEPVLLAYLRTGILLNLGFRNQRKDSFTVEGVVPLAHTFDWVAKRNARLSRLRLGNTSTLSTLESAGTNYVQFQSVESRFEKDGEISFARTPHNGYDLGANALLIDPYPHTMVDFVTLKPLKDPKKAILYTDGGNISEERLSRHDEKSVPQIDLALRVAREISPSLENADLVYDGFGSNRKEAVFPLSLNDKQLGCINFFYESAATSFSCNLQIGIKYFEGHKRRKKMNGIDENYSVMNRKVQLSEANCTKN